MTNLPLFRSFGHKGRSIVLNTLVFGRALVMVLFMTYLPLFGSFDLKEWRIVLNTLVFVMALAMVVL